ncbi:MAG: folate-binding protein [Actinomycetota bacterium]|nr:folate-binding protein [Actinomycetota bacterium]
MAVADRIAADYEALTSGCGLLDRSERGKLALTGGAAKEFLNGQVSNDVEVLEPGRGCYATFLTHKGKMLGDLRVLDLGEELFLDTERVALQDLFNLIRRFKLGFDVELHKRTLERGLLSLIGPGARAIAGAGALGDEEHDNAGGDVDGVPVRFVATDVGVDVLCASEYTDALRAALQARGAVPVEEAAVEALRVAHGRPRYGIDLDDSTIPQEAGLNERAVSFTKGCYVGQETVARLHWRGKPNRHLRGLGLSAPAQTGDELRLGDKVVGRLGSVALSPAHGPIALAIVRREARPGDTLAVGGAGVTAEVVDLPF